MNKLNPDHIISTNNEIDIEASIDVSAATSAYISANDLIKNEKSFNIE